MAALTKAEMAERLYEELGFNKREAKELVELFFEEIRNALESNEQVKLSGFGNFDLRDKRQRRAIGIIIVRHNDRALARRHSEIDHVIAHGRGQHDTGDIIAGKAQRAFDCPCGRNDLSGPNLPQTMTRCACLWRVIRNPFISQHIAMIVNASAHAAGADRDVGAKSPNMCK